MRTTYNTSASTFCVDCKETGGIFAQAPLTFYCMASKCTKRSKRCELVKHGGVRP